MRYFAALMMLLFISSCGDETEYDYKNVNKTEGLEVSPSSLILSADNRDGYFTLIYSTGDLFLRGAENKLGGNFTMEPDADSLPNSCLSSVQTYAYCHIKVSYDPNAGNEPGTIVLKFHYVKDKNAEQAKNHELKVKVSISGTPENSAPPAARVIIF